MNKYLIIVIDGFLLGLVLGSVVSGLIIILGVL
jgi:hypothetical protein